MKLLNSFKIAFAMFSKVPVGKAEWTKENMRYSMCFVPLIGFLIAGMLSGWYWVNIKCGFNDIFYACIAVLIPLLITGGIHMDGYIDVVDALSSYGDKQKKLEILKDPHVGAFAIIWTAAYMIAMAGMFTQVVSLVAVAMIGMEFVLSRALSCLLAIFLKNAKKEGTLYAFTSSQQKGAVSIVLMLYVFGAGIGLCLMDFLVGLLVLLVEAIVILYYRVMTYRNFGGITGDMAGFFVQVSEAAMIFATVIGCRIVEIL